MGEVHSANGVLPICATVTRNRFYYDKFSTKCSKCIQYLESAKKDGDDDVQEKDELKSLSKKNKEQGWSLNGVHRRKRGGGGMIGLEGKDDSQKIRRNARTPVIQLSLRMPI